MRVRELISRLQGMDPELLVEFHDVAYSRQCPVNFISVQPKLRGDPIKGDRVVLTNRLGA